MKTLETYFIWMMLYSVVGWVYESILFSLKEKQWINRGFLNGPYCPIYGVGAVLIIAALGDVANPWLLFVGSALLACSLEYATSYVLEKLFHARWWDYSENRFNIHGRICLLGATAFGAFSVVLLKVVHPAVAAYTATFPASLRAAVAAALLLILLLDTCLTTAKLTGFHKKLQRQAAGMMAILERARR